MSRALVVVLDACGVGALPDAAEYGDAGTNTLGHLAREAGGLSLPALGRLGLGNVLALLGVPPAGEPVLHGRLHPLGPGKDSITGHWELMGVVVERALPTYPHGVPPALLERLVAAIGRDGSAASMRGEMVSFKERETLVDTAGYLDRSNRYAS